MGISSLRLLPQSPKTQIPTHLKFSRVLFLLNFFTVNAARALNNFFIKKNLHEFDPHVGETSCQIRAYQVLLLNLSYSKEYSQKIKLKLITLNNIIDKIKSKVDFYLKIDNTRQVSFENHRTLEQFAIENEYAFQMDEIEFFLIQSFLLTKYRTFLDDGNPIINYNLLKQDLGVSKHTSRNLVHQYQINLSHNSCDFVLELSKQLSYSPVPADLLKELMQTDEDERSVLPCYYIMKILFEHMKHNKIKLLLIADRIKGNQYFDTLFFTFKMSGSGIEYEEVTPTDEPYYVVKGITNYIGKSIESKQQFTTRLLATGLEKIIFLNMAAHPQYPGKKLAFLSNALFASPHSSDQYTDLKQNLYQASQEAKLLGCSAEDPSLFLITHIFCDSLRRQVELWTPEKRLITESRM